MTELAEHAPQKIDLKMTALYILRSAQLRPKRHHQQRHRRLAGISRQPRRTDHHGDSIDPKTVRFTQLRDLIMALPEFDDDPARCGERILEAVQQAWIDETE